MVMTLNFAQRTRAREIFRAIQERTPNTYGHAQACASCGIRFDNSPCSVHPGLCCSCVDVVAKIEHKEIAHED